MSIYIKNLNKPVGDEVIVLMPDGAALLKGYPQPLETIEIIEVPEHGRLIDADEIIPQLLEAENGATSKSLKLAIAMLKGFVEDTTTVIPADKESEA